MRRRIFLQSSITALGGALLASCGLGSSDSSGASDSSGSSSVVDPDDTRRWLMPDEGDRHARTWMAFVAEKDIWGRDLAPGVKRDLAGIATAIAAFEPVSLLVPEHEMDLARELTGTAGVDLVACELDDLWVRDTGPVFVRPVDGGEVSAGVDFNFNGWGDKQEHRSDREVAGFVTGEAGVEHLRTDLVLEGGALEVDGEGTAIITESCVLNDNRNPGWSKQDVEEELERLLGVTTVIWLPGIAGMDITDGHTDFYARFARPGVVVAGLETDPDSFDYDVTRTHLDILRGATDAAGRELQVEVLECPSSVREEYDSEDFAAGYINFYLCNGAVIVPEFGAEDTDTAARDLLRRLFPEREVVQLNIDAIAAGGGGIHCATQQQPA